MTTSDFWTVAEAAEHAGCTQETVRKAIRTGKLQAFRRESAKGYQLRPEDVKAWCEPRAVNPEERPGSPSSGPSAGDGVSDPGVPQEGPA